MLPKPIGQTPLNGFNSLKGLSFPGGWTRPDSAASIASLAGCPEGQRALGPILSCCDRTALSTVACSGVSMF
jgi:hypothetical protein